VAEPPIDGRWLLYGVTDCSQVGDGAAGSLARVQPGAFGLPSTRLLLPPLSAVVAALPADCALGKATTADLLAYGRTIAAVHAQQTIIPIRFGSVLSSEAALRDYLAQNAATYQLLLAKLRGTEELAVRWHLPAAAATASGPAPGPIATGTAYLRARQAAYAEAERQKAAKSQQAEQLRRALLPHTLATTVEPSRDGEPPSLAAACLVRRGESSGLRQRVAELAAELGARLTVSGPLPPYSFVELTTVAALPAPAPAT
jgi:hypothetical protein